jgi:galactokinase
VTEVDETRVEALVAALPAGGRTVLARAPGRVNVIGDHTDYNGLPVLPFTMERDVLIAARARTDGRITIGNRDPRHGAREFHLRQSIAPFAAGDWGNYVKAAVQALAGGGGPVPPGGAALMVDGRVPVAAGVSSSSALVVASALALAALGDRPVDRLALADLLARGEQYVGTLSGGMDQAAILHGRPRHALRIDFSPLRVRWVRMPDEATFVVAHTRDEAAKSGAAQGQYNQRVIECRLACAVLARRLGVDLPNLGALPDGGAVLGGLDKLLPDGILSRADLTGRAGLDREQVERLIPPGLALADADRFALRARVRHVLSEAGRVAAAESALAGGDLDALGALLDASQASGAADYGTSTAAADVLVRIGREAGALGGRLMGAGFGGSVVLLARRDRTEAIIDALDRRFYGSAADARAWRFVAAPAAGAKVARVDCEPAVC